MTYCAFKTCKITRTNKYFASRYPQAFLLLLKEIEACIFTQKWLDHLLLITSYLITVRIDRR